MREIKYVTLHTQAAFNRKTGKVRHGTAAELDSYHREHNGWIQGGYNYFINEHGEIESMRPEEMIPAAVYKFNTNQIAICVSGHGDQEAWNRAQLDAVTQLCVRLCKKYGIPAENVVGHAECDDLPEYKGPPIYKTCPGILVDMNAIREAIAEGLEPPVRNRVDIIIRNLEEDIADAMLQVLKERGLDAESCPTVELL